MARVFISVLGTGDYVPCSYRFNDGTVVSSVRFVQEATVSYSCMEWSDQDRILIFTTEGSRTKNWEDSGATDVEGNPLEGLAARLNALPLRVPFCNVMIPDGKIQEEIWEIFQALLANLMEGDEVVFDITHSFRSIPMLVLVVLNYAKVVKKVTLRGIYYGALEALGVPSEVRSMPMAKRIVPVFDLTAFDKLLDWTTAIDRFIGGGDASLVSELAKQAVLPMTKPTKGADRAAKAVKRIAMAINAFASNVSACRGRSLSGAAAKLKHSLADGKSSSDKLIPALSPLLASIQPKLQGFVGDEVRDGVAAVHWCLEHNLIQQGFTILQETLVSYLIHQIGEKPHLVRNRKIATASLGIVKSKAPEEDWQDEAARDIEKTRKFVALLESRQDLRAFFIGGPFEKLKEFRNDLNHGGYTGNTHDAEEFSEVLSHTLTEVEKFLH
ncbi:MAG: TIGR02221 family CRISPR-associated protein [Desulfomonilaceae bacterium]